MTEMYTIIKEYPWSANNVIKFKAGTRVNGAPIGLKSGRAVVVKCDVIPYPERKLVVTFASENEYKYYHPITPK